MKYSSCIKVGGRPILPPVMTAARFEEMRRFKEIAVEREKRRKQNRKLSSENKLEKVKAYENQQGSSSTQAHTLVSPTEELTRKSCSSNLSQQLNDHSIINMTKAFKEHMFFNYSNDCNVKQKVTDMGSGDYPRMDTVPAKVPTPENTNTFLLKPQSMKTELEKDVGFSRDSPVEPSCGSISSMNADAPSDSDDQIEGSSYFRSESDLINTLSEIDFPCHDQGESPGAIVVEGKAELDHSFNESHDTLSCGASSRTACTVASTPPSLASTELGKYMKVSPGDSDTFTNCLTTADEDFSTERSHAESCFSRQQESVDSTSVSSSTLKADSECNTEIENTILPVNTSCSTKSPTKRCVEDGDKNDLLPQLQKFKCNDRNEESRHGTNSSYTLECPSDALVAHAQLCEEYGFPASDMSSVRRQSVEGSKEHERTNSSASQTSGMMSVASDVLNKNKQHQLENYLQNLSSFPGGFTDEINTDDDAIHDFPTPRGLDALNDIANGFTTVDELLNGQNDYYIKLRERLAAEHRTQMDRLFSNHEQDTNSGTELEDTENHRESIDTNTEVYSRGTKFIKNGYFPPIDAEVPREESRYELEPNDIPNQDRTKVLVSDRYKLIPTCINLFVPPEALDDDTRRKFELVTATAKGFLTRRLMETERVQGIIKTIKDTLEFAMTFHSETQVRNGRVTPAEANLHKGLLVQLTNACHEFHDIFFKLSIPERMAIICQDRDVLKAKFEKEDEMTTRRRLSSATLKALERKNSSSRSDSRSSKASTVVTGRSKSCVPWSTSPKRRRMSLEVSKKKNVTKATFRSKTASPQFTKRSSMSSKVQVIGKDRGVRNVRRSLTSAYSAYSAYSSSLDTKSVSRTPRLSATTLAPTFTLARSRRDLKRV